MIFRAWAANCEKLIDTLSPETGLSDENICWIFAGDLFVAGKTPKKSFDILEPALSTLPNVHLVMGNHERSIMHTIRGVRRYRAPAKPRMRLLPTACTTAE